MTTEPGTLAPRAGAVSIPARVFLVAALATAGVAACLVAGIGPVARTPVVSPFQALLVERTVLHPGHIELGLRNATGRPITVTQVAVDQAFWNHSLTPRTVAPRGRATLVVDYPWEPGHTVPIFLLTTTGAEITHVLTRPVASMPGTPRGGRELVLSLALVVAPLLAAAAVLWWLTRSATPWSGGVATGVALGVAGAFLASGAREAVRAARTVSPFIGGRLLVALAALAALFFALWLRRVTGAVGDTTDARPRSLAGLVATGVGLYGLGVGLALGRGLANGALTLGGVRSLSLLAQAGAGGLAIVAVLGPAALADRRRALRLTPAAGVGMVAGMALGRLVGTPTWSAAGIAASVGAVAVVAWSVGRRWLADEGGAVVGDAAAAAAMGAFVLTILAAVAP